MARYPAISVRQPWAELILRGQKTIDVRTWHRSYRGPLWLHTGKRAEGYAQVEYELRDPSMRHPFRGGFVGLVQLVGIIPLDADNWEQLRPHHLSAGPLQPGLFGILLAAPRRIVPPFEAPGALDLFTCERAIEVELERRLESSVSS